MIQLYSNFSYAMAHATCIRSNIIITDDNNYIFTRLMIKSNIIIYFLLSYHKILINYNLLLNSNKLILTELTIDYS